MAGPLVPLMCFLILTIGNAIWIARDNRPPFWDMAYHQVAAIRIVDAFSETGLSALTRVFKLTGLYPPVYHTIVAAFYGVFGISARVGQIANIPAAAIVILATYALARSLLAPPAPAAAAALITFFPMMIWFSRAAMIDYWLSSLVALAMWTLLRTEEFTNRRASIAFGVICGVGLLTKASFAAFVGLPALWAARSNWKNALASAAIALAMAACWYAPRWDTFMSFYEFNSASGLAEGDPVRVSWQSVLFYVRAMEGYQLFLPLFVLFCLALVSLARAFDAKWIPVSLWIVGGWAGLLLLANKDPRYSMPLLPAVALITARLFERRPLWFAALAPFLLFQGYMVSFGIAALPDAVTLADGPASRPPWNWHLYAQSYAGLWGRPVTAEWRVDQVIDKVTEERPARLSRIGLGPDIPSFDAHAFAFEIARRRVPLVVNPAGMLDENTIDNNEYLLVEIDDRGVVERFLADHRASLSPLDSFPLPGGATVRLLRVVR